MRQHYHCDKMIMIRVKAGVAPVLMTGMAPVLLAGFVAAAVRFVEIRLKLGKLCLRSVYPAGSQSRTPSRQFGRLRALILGRSL